MRARIVPIGLAVGAALAGCSLLFPFDGYGPGTPPDAQAPDASDASKVCGERWPDRPAKDDPSDGDVEVVLAMDAFDFGIADAGVPGFNLDGLCTCPDPAPCLGKTLACDADGGIDNGLFAFVDALASFGGVFDQVKANEVLRQGTSFGVVLVLKRYNGTLNDTSVQLGSYPSNGTEIIDDAGTHATPRFDGTDVWTIDPHAVVGGAGPPYIPVAVDNDAYVVDGVLVAHSNVPFVIPTTDVGLSYQLQDGVMVAPLVRDGALWRVRGGHSGGRVSTRAVLTSLAAIPDPFKKTIGLCGDSGTYRSIKPQLCGSADIMTAAAQDGTGASCNAFSIGMSFTAVSAKLGKLGGGPPDASAGCGPSYSDDCTDQ